MSQALPKEVAHAITRYGQHIIFENMWNYHNVSSILSAHSNIPENIACQFETQALLQRCVAEFQEFLFSDFQSRVRDSPLSSEAVDLLTQHYLRNAREAEMALDTICSDAYQNGSSGIE